MGVNQRAGGCSYVVVVILYDMRVNKEDICGRVRVQ